MIHAQPRSLPDSIGAAPVAAVRWGGLADTVRQDCCDADNLDAKTADLLQRLDELAARSGLNEVAQFLDSPRGFSVLERNYLMSPLLDEIYACLTVPLRSKRFDAPVSGSAAPVMPVEVGMADDAAGRVPVRPDGTGLAVLVACMKGCVEALEFILGRERHLVSGMSCVQLVTLIGGVPANVVGRWTECSQKGLLIVQPLAIASYWGHVSCVECLLRHGADVHGDQDCALRCAADQGRDPVVDLLLRAGADVHAQQDVALRVAVCGGHLLTVKRLLQAGADVTVDYQAVIWIAARIPHAEVLRCLLGALSDKPVNSRALLAAVSAFRPDSVQLLLDRGADPNFDGGQPLEFAVGNPNASPDVVVAMVDMLIKAGADMHENDDVALRTAIRSGTPVFVQRLLHHGASLQAVFDEPQITIDAVAARGDIPMMEVLLDAGMTVDAAGASEVLSTAAEHQHTAVIELFERRGASPVSTDSARLIAAARQGDLQLVQELLKRELDPVVLHGQALQLAVDRCHRSVIAALLEHGQRVGPAPPETSGYHLRCLFRAARSGAMDMFRLLVDHIFLDASQLTLLLRVLLGRAVGYDTAAAKLLLDRYARTVLSVAEMKQLLASIPRDGPGAAVLRLYTAASRG